MATAAQRNVDVVDMGMLIGSVRRFGLAGPAYEVIGPALSSQMGEARMQVHLLESNETVDYPVGDILNDPVEV